MAIHENAVMSGVAGSVRFMIDAPAVLRVFLGDDEAGVIVTSSDGLGRTLGQWSSR